MRYLLLLLIAGPLFSMAQPPPATSGWKINIAGGGAFGESLAGVVMQAGGGFQFNNFYTGIGVAYDKHRFETYPVFADLRFTPARLRRVFLYGQLGYAFPNGSGYSTNEFFQSSVERSGGLYTDMGAGYNMVLRKKHAFAIALGYSIKKVREEKSFTPCPFCPGPNGDQVSVSHFDYEFSRIMARLVYELAW